MYIYIYHLCVQPSDKKLPNHRLSCLYGSIAWRHHVVLAAGATSWAPSLRRKARCDRDSASLGALKRRSCRLNSLGWNPHIYRYN